jgi:hypothetical protein
MKELKAISLRQLDYMEDNYWGNLLTEAFCLLAS